MANAHILGVAIDFLIDKWGAMGKETAYRKDYRGVRRFAYDLPLEEDEHLPWVQADIGDSDLTRPEGSGQIFLTQEVFAQVHVFADKLENGDYDIITPLLAVMADIHFAAFEDRNLGGTNYLYLDLGGHEIRPFAIGGVSIGATLRATYQIMYWFNANDMSDAPS